MLFWSIHWHTIYANLVANGFYRDLLSSGIIAVIGFAAGLFFATKPFRKLRQKIEGIKDALDTETPGGLEKVEKTLEEIRDHLSTHDTS